MEKNMQIQIDKRDDERNGVMQRFFENCSIRAAEGEGNERRFTLSFSSEDPYERWWGVEILSHADDAVDLTRLNTIGCVLYNHDRDKVIGKILSAKIEDERGVAEIEFDDDEASEVIFKKVASGTLKGVSVGYQVSEWIDIQEGHKSDDGKYEGPCSIATKWMPYEVSIVSIPADPTVGVGRSHEPAGNKPEEKGVSGFYYYEKQLQINKNLLKEVKK